MIEKPKNEAREPDPRRVLPGTAAADDRDEEGTELGAVRIHHGVVAMIARLATLKVPGVVETGGSIADGIASLIGKTAGERGIRVDVEGSTVNIEIQVVMEYGVRIPQVAWQIQNDVRKAVEDMTGKRVNNVDVVVQGVKPAEAKAEDKLS